MTRQAARASGTAEGGGNTSLESEIEAAAERGEARMFFSVGGIDDLPVERGVLFDGGGVGKAPAENGSVGVDLTESSTNEGAKVVALVVVVNKVVGVLALVGDGDGMAFVGAPGSGVGSLADEGMGHRDVRNDVMNVAAPVELDVGAAARVRGIRGCKRAREGGLFVRPGDARGRGDFFPDVKDVFMGSWVRWKTPGE